MRRGAAGLVLLLAALVITGTAPNSPAATTAPPAPPAICSGSGVPSLQASTDGTRLRVTFVPVCSVGSIVIAYHGSPAAGCRARGVCSVTGVERWSAQPQSPYVIPIGPTIGTGAASIVTIRRPGHVEVRGGLDLASLTAVQGDDSGGPGGACRSAGSHGPDDGTITIGANRTARISLAGAADWIGTRCAGPIGADVDRALPTARLPLATLLQGRPEVSLAGTRMFSGGGFTGTVTSTLALRLGRAGPPHRLATHLRTARVPTAPLRAVAAVGVIHVRAMARPPGCRALGACGETFRATIGVHELGAVDGSLTRNTTANGHALHGLPALLGGLRWRNRGTLSVKVAGCRDQVPVPQVGMLLGAERLGDRLVVGISPSTNTYDPLRTRCPGPTSGPRLGIFGLTLTPAAGVIGRSATVHLTHQSAFNTEGWRVRVSGQLAITLRAGHFRLEPVGGSPTGKMRTLIRRSAASDSIEGGA